MFYDFLGFRTFEQINMKFHLFFASKAKPEQGPPPGPVAPSVAPPLRRPSGTVASSSGGGASVGGGSSVSQQFHSPVPVLQANDSAQSFTLLDSISNSSSLTSPQPLIGSGSRIDPNQVSLIALKNNLKFED